jgi:hypothetical protein
MIDTSEVRHEPTDSNIIDAEFSEIENGGYSLEEQADLVRTVLDDLEHFDSPLRKKADKARAIDIKYPDGRDGIKHFYLPADFAGMPPEFSSIYTDITEKYDSGAYCQTTGKHTTAKVRQGKMWVIPKRMNPYLEVSMSECSFMTAKAPMTGDLIAAHISYSQLPAIESVMRFMSEKGIRPEDIKIIASVGEYQERRAKDVFPMRAKIEDYKKLGIQEQNLLPFVYSGSTKIDDDSRLSRGITKGIVGNSFLFAYSHDLLTEYRNTALFSAKETRVGGYKQERVLQM